MIIKGENDLESEILHNYKEYNIYKEKHFKIRYELLKLIADNNLDKDFSYPAYCEVCNKVVNLKVDWLYSNNNMPNYRERLVCPECELNNRQRFMVSYIRDIILNNKYNSIYMYESVTHFFQLLKNEFPQKNIVGSEYLGHDCESGKIYNNIRHEDAMNMSFPDRSFDLLISNEVLEHIPDYKKALKESYRILKKNGKFIITIPFYSESIKTEQRAELSGTGINNLKEPQYHGNPVSDSGSLVFWDFGWDFLDECRKTGFKRAYLYPYFDMLKGYLGVFPFIIVAEK